MPEVSNFLQLTLNCNNMDSHCQFDVPINSLELYTGSSLFCGILQCSSKHFQLDKHFHSMCQSKPLSGNSALHCHPTYV